MKVFTVTIHAFGKHIIERVEADSRDEARTKVVQKYGIAVTVRPA